MTETMDRATLFDKIHTRQAEFDALLAGLSEQQMTTPGVNGAWSVKDILAHLTNWEHLTVDRVRAAAHHQEPQLLRITNEDEMNDYNDRSYEENRSRPLQDVLSGYRQTHAQLLDAVQEIGDDDLLTPNRFAWLEDRAIWQVVAANTYEHIDEHIPAIQTWVAQHP
jgi:hypothetical protein